MKLQGGEGENGTFATGESFLLFTAINQPPAEEYEDDGLLLPVKLSKTKELKLDRQKVAISLFRSFLDLFRKP